ncbi:MAG: RdgB/HAM1 family non-canonical purine NTP pyrophosphatase [Anaerococcus sp.]|nr:RdgB/HAM1 family non-canonical purine NTP pyrophosphatase [Anaerococcus sp.]MDD7044128.1 RdgB/HAM1 family non-canonical purine NTP pyrophosphatase [Peptoniphilaceae bacterium]MDY2918809.1 RdgB/HAM1 family non-canonical purine NTP pyrophosphatase [Anaerococcus sp.]
MDLLFASGNKNKAREVRNLLNGHDVKTPSDFGIDNFEVEEDGETLRENAYKKAKALYDLTKTDVFADDTGLFVEALGGRPGVHAHRYAGLNPTDSDNRKKLLSELKGVDNRRAAFKTTIAYINKNGETFYFEGVLDGSIGLREVGENNFGYDSIFVPEGSQKSLAEISSDEKNKISHRSRAVEEFRKFLG